MSSTCSNCFRKLPKSRAVLTVEFSKPDTGEDVTLTLKEAIAYMIKARPPDSFPDELSLCLPCNHIFVTMLDNYLSFLKRSKTDSPVYQYLRSEAELVDIDIEYWQSFDDSLPKKRRTGEEIPDKVDRRQDGNKGTRRSRRRKSKDQPETKTKTASMTAAEAEGEFYKIEDGSTLLRCVKCPEVEVAFTSVTDWADHYMYVHGENVGWGHGPIIKPGNKKPLYKKLLPCPVCWKAMPTVFMSAHVDAIHHNKPQFICPICDKGFTRKLTLKQHSLIHTEGFKLNTHLCLRCGSTFRNKANLTRHEMAHTQEFPRPFKCEKCGAAFEIKMVLENHLWTHIPIDDRPKTFPCTRCPRAFETQKRLRSHLREHKQSETRDAKCIYCEKAYHRKNALKDHLMSFHKLGDGEAKAAAGIASKIMVIRDGVEYPPTETRPMKPTTWCEICSRKYSRREYLTTHYMALHGKTEAEAKALTGLESRRSLTVPSTSRAVGRKPKREKEQIVVLKGEIQLEEVEQQAEEVEMQVEVGEDVEGVATVVQFAQEQYWINPASLPASFYTTL